MQERQGVLHNVSRLTAGYFLSQLLNLWALVFLAGFLGSHWFGVVQLGVTFMAYALIIGEWGLTVLGIREVSRLDDRSRILAYARGHVGLFAVQAVAVTAVLWLTIPHLRFAVGDPWVFRIYLGAVILQVGTFAWILVGLERMTMVGVGRILLSALYAVFVLVLLKPLAGGDPARAARWVPAMYLGAVLGGNVLLAVSVRRALGGDPWPVLPALREAARRWRETAPLGANVVAGRLLLNLDLLVLGMLATPSAAGNYAAAARITFVLVVALEILWSALLPRLSRLAQEDPAGFRRAFNFYLGLVLAALLPAAVGGALLGGPFVDLLYGDQYPEAGGVFRILAVSYSFLAVGTFLGNALVASDRQKEYLAPLLVSAAVAVGAVIMLWRLLGTIGTAWGMFAAHGLLLLILVGLWRRVFNGALGRLLLGLVPALAILVGVAALTGGQHVLVRIAAAGTAYTAAAAVPALGFLRRQRSRG